MAAAGVLVVMAAALAAPQHFAAAALFVVAAATLAPGAGRHVVLGRLRPLRDLVVAAAVFATTWGGAFVALWLWHGAAPGVARPSAPGALLALAFVEELFFRGWLHSRLHGLLPASLRIGRVEVAWASVAGAALFGLAHWARAGIESLALFWPGLLLAELRVRTGGVWSGWLVHALFNLFRLDPAAAG